MVINYFIAVCAEFFLPRDSVITMIYDESCRSFLSGMERLFLVLESAFQV